MEIRIERDAWIAGFRAGELGRPSCPYPSPSAAAHSWYSGYVEGKAKRQEDVWKMNE